METTSPAPAEPRDSLVGSSIGDRYAVTRRLGRGGMGVVYEADHLALGRKVALKVLKTDRAREPVARARFEREARAAASIGNEHIVDVHDFGVTPDGEPYIVMELLDGVDLASLIVREGPLPAGRALGIARQLGRALSAAHDKGIIHRDLKSENVFVLDRDGKDFVKLLDFGISKIQEASDQPALTGSDVLLGTPRYMAPEQARGETDLDRRVDVYALGVILYEMLTGRVPFLGRTSMEIIQKHLHATPDPPRQLRPDIPEEVERVVMHALVKDRDDRYATVRELCADLPPAEDYPGGERAWPVPAPSTEGRISSPSRPAIPRSVEPSGERTRSERPTVRAVRRRGAIVVGALLLLLAVGLAIWPITPAPRHARTRPRARPAPERVVEERVVQVPAPPPRAVVVRIHATPRSARILVGSELRGRGEATIEAPRSELPIPVRVEADGYVAQTLLVVPREDALREVNLERAHRPGPVTPGSTPTPTKTPGPDDLMGSPYPREPRR